MTDYTNGPTADDIEMFGEDLVQFAQRAAAPVVQRRTVELERQLQATQAELRTQRIERALDSDPVTRDRWRKINVDPEFYDTWLSEIHELTGQPRMNHLRRAEAVGDTTTICNLFRSFILLERMPGRVRSERLPFENAPRTPAPSGSKRIWTRAAIREFYDAARKGRYSADEKQRLEADILRAPYEGRLKDPPMKLDKGFAV